MFALPIAHLCNELNKGSTTYRMRSLRKKRPAQNWKMPVFKLDPSGERFPADKHGFTSENIWGITAVILDAFLGILVPNEHQWLCNQYLLPALKENEK